MEVLSCPFCYQDLKVEERPTPRHQDLWFLRCTGCEAEFPVFLERPILVPKGVEGWLSAIDQAVGWLGPRRAGIVSLAWLAEQFGSGRKPEDLVRWKAIPWKGRSRDEWIELVRNLREEAETRRSGKWFEETERRRNMLESALAPIAGTAEERPILDEFAERVLQARPLRLLDVASGGGFAVTRILAHMKEVEYVAAVEKDLRCLWGIQYKADYVARRSKIGEAGLRFEAVGADARQLPFRDESFDFASLYHGLGEICGVGDVLREVHRILETGGRFQLSFHDAKLANYGPPEDVKSLLDDLTRRGLGLSEQEKDFIAANLPKLVKEEFLEFLEAADLFINLDHLEKQAKECGFEIIEKHIHRGVPSRSRRAPPDFIILLRKATKQKRVFSKV